VREIWRERERLYWSRESLIFLFMGTTVPLGRRTYKRERDNYINEEREREREREREN
jgi:hypothetical protein